MTDDRIFGFDGDYRFLSNFYVESDGTTAEHRFQASKAIKDDDKARIMAASTPTQAKRLGRVVQMTPNWDTYRHTAMKMVLLYKFRDEALRAKLLATGDRELLEANSWHDVYWGVDKWTGNGENWLGKTLMELRQEYREGKYDFDQYDRNR